MPRRVIIVSLVSLLVSVLGAGGVAIASTAAPGDTASTVTLFANFSADTPGAAPNTALPGAPTGDFLTLDETSGTVRVNAAIDGLTMAAQLKQQNGIGGVSLFGWPAAPPAHTEQVMVGWRSVAQDDNPNVIACTLRGSNGNVIASVEYLPHGGLTYNGLVGTGQPIPVTYQQNRNDAFRLVVDFTTSRVSLEINGAAVPGFQSVPFAQPASDFARVGFEAGGSSPQTFGVDDIYVVAFSREPDQAPIVTAPPSAAVEELGQIDVTVTASDPDGDPISALAADLSALPSGHTATFTADAANTSGTFSWTPSLGQAGVYPLTFTAASNSATGTASTNLFVAALGTAVTGRFIWTPQVGEEGTYTVTFVATDLGGTETLPVLLTVLPDGSLVARPDPNRAPAAPSAPDPGALAPESPMKGPVISIDGSTTTKSGRTTTLTATATSSGTTLAGRFERVSSPTALRAAAEGLITLSADLSGLPPGNDAVFVIDRDPIVSAPATKQGDVGVPLTVNVGADDLDADPIATLTADLSGLPAGATFTKNATNTLGTLSWTPAASDTGNFSVTFQATNRLVGSATTVIHVRGTAPTRCFVANGRKVNLGSGKPFYNVAIEPIDGSFVLTDVDPLSVMMISSGTGSISQIGIAPKTQGVIGDRDGNTIADMTLSFAKADLRRLFSSLRGNVTVPVTIQGNLTTGGRFTGTLNVEVNAGGGKLAATVIPNPLNPSASLRFVTTRAGEASVRLYDASGRMVRELLPRTSLAAGEHEILIRGEDGAGRRLASGVYFFRVEAKEGSSVGRIAVVK